MIGKKRDFNKNRWRNPIHDLSNTEAFKSLFDKIKELKDLNPYDFDLEMGKLIDKQVENTEYAKQMKEEQRLNNFMFCLENFRRKKKHLREIISSGLKFKSPFEFGLASNRFNTDEGGFSD